MPRPATALALVAAAAALLAGCAAGGGAAGSTGAAAATAASSFRGFPLSAPFARPHLTLTDTSGRSYDFAARTRGRVTLVYLGYTHCTDTCPAMMADVAAALRGLPAADAGKVTVVFITTDPRRDTGPVMRRWLDKFDPSFVGLTGTTAQLAATDAAFGVNPKVVVRPNGAEQVEHSADVFAFGTDDQARLSYDPDSTPADYRHDLALLVAGHSPPAPTAAQLRETGGSGRVGLVKAFNAFLTPAPGGGLQLQLTLLNSGDGPAELTGATSSTGGQTALERSGGSVAAIPLPANVPVSLGGRDRVMIVRPQVEPRPGQLVRVVLLLSGGAQLPLTAVDNG